MWERHEAVDLCRALYAISEEYGCFPALTGGLLYKAGPRKDCDILFYRHRQCEKINVAGLFVAMSDLGVKRLTEDDAWCVKALWREKPVDFFFPDAGDGDYDRTELEMARE